MKSTLEYKAYIGNVDVDPEEKILRGKVLGIRDKILYEGKTVEELEFDFHEAIDFYIETCRKNGKEPEKPFSGKFIVRIDPELHKAAAMEANENGMSLNTWTVIAIKKALDTEAILSLPKAGNEFLIR